MNEPDVRELLAKAQELQGKLTSLQQELARRTIEAAAGGGMVSVVMSGDLRVREVRIDPELLRENDRAMLQDLCAAAVNAAIAKAAAHGAGGDAARLGPAHRRGRPPLVRTPAPIERLVAALRRLPGIGEKSATRLAFFLLSAPESVGTELADAIARVKREIVLCEICFDLTDVSPCAICRDPKRDPGLVCVVEEPADRAAVERSGGFGGRYHVLGGALAPLDGIGPEALHGAELEARVRAGGVREVILATNPNAEGDATAHWLAERLGGSGVKVTRIAYGMPLGGDLEYADHVTVGRSLANRRAFD